MTSLQELDNFIVGRGTGIDSLPALNLRGCLRISFRGVLRCDDVLEAQRALLKDNQQLTSLVLKFFHMEKTIDRKSDKLVEKSIDCKNAERLEEMQDVFRFTKMKYILLSQLNIFSDFPSDSEKVDTRDSGKMDTMLSSLQLSPNLECMKIDSYQGEMMPRKWFDGLSKLVSIRIVGCARCIVLPRLSRLPCLKYLNLEFLHNLEYIDDIWVGGASGSIACNDYFPSLEVLDLRFLENVKKWTRHSKEDDDGVPRQLVFPRLLEMSLCKCPKLMSMPIAPKLESLDVRGINGNLFKSNLMLKHEDQEASATLFTSLKELDFLNVDDVDLSISGKLCNLQTVKVHGCNKMKSLTLESSDSIRHLTIQDCESLKKLSMGNLSALEMLTVEDCEGLAQLPQSIAYLTTLQHLKIESLKLVHLPEEMGNLSSLHKLEIIDCPNLASLPPSLLGLASLQTLEIFNCPHLEQGLKQPNGQHCHLISNIPRVVLYTNPEWQSRKIKVESESEDKSDAESEAESDAEDDISV